MRLPPIAELVPHTPPMLLLDELVEADDAHAVARLRITEASPFFENGAVPAVITLEYMAQTIAAYGGAQRRREGLPIQRGLLLACPRLSLQVDALLPGDELSVEARRVWHADNLAQFDCVVSRAGQPVAQASLDVYVGDPEEAAAG